MSEQMFAIQSDLRPVFVLVEGEPQGKGRPRFAKQGAFVRVFTDERTRAYEELIAGEARLAMRGRELISGPVLVEMKMGHSIRPSWTKAKKAAARAGDILPTIKIDIDNCLKVFCDAMNGVVWNDDVQVTKVIIEKEWAESPFVLCHIVPIDKGNA